MSRLCISGSRNFPENEKDKVIQALKSLMSGWEKETGEGVYFLHIGDCPTGVDKFVRDYYSGRFSSWGIIVHEANWERHGNRAGPIRNQEMIDRSDLLLAFPLQKSRGTIDTIRRAKAKKIPVYIYQDGHVHLEKN